MGGIDDVFVDGVQVGEQRTGQRSLVLTSPASGTGAGSVTFNVAVTTGPSRSDQPSALRNRRSALRDDAAGDAVTGVAGRIGRQVVALGMNDERCSAVREYRIRLAAQRDAA